MAHQLTAALHLSEFLSLPADTTGRRNSAAAQEKLFWVVAHGGFEKHSISIHYLHTIAKIVTETGWGTF